jgi:hypothetical protein
MSSFGSFGPYQDSQNDLALLVENNTILRELEVEVQVVSDGVAVVGENRTNITANTAAIATIEEDVSQNQTDISQNAAAILQLTTDVSQNKLDISANDVSIASIEADVSQNQLDISDNSGSITSIILDVSQNRGDILDNSNQLPGIIADVSQNQVDISQNLAFISQVELDVSQNTFDVSINTSAIAAIFAELSGGSLDVSGIINDVCQNTIDISQNRFDISSIILDASQNTFDISQNRTDISTNVLDISNNDGRITVLESKVKKYLYAYNSSDITFVDNALGEFEIPLDVVDISDAIFDLSNLDASGVFAINEEGLYFITMQTTLQQGASGAERAVYIYLNEIIAGTPTYVTGSTFKASIYDDTKMQTGEVTMLLDLSGNEVFNFVFLQELVGTSIIPAQTCRLIVEKVIK